MGADMEDIMVSVIVIVYNQEKYIEEALNSILRQKTEFTYEILISDDASTDSTPEILKSFKHRYPDKIRLILRKRNVGATANAYGLLIKAKGKYIASLEGDDYWSDELKLQRQTEFLEKHPEFIGIENSCLVVNEDGIPIPEMNRNDGYQFWMFSQKRYTFDDFCHWKMPGHMSAMLYRNIYREQGERPVILYKAHPMIGDRTILMLLSAKGDICCQENPVMYYRLVEKEDGDNWMSCYKRENRRLDEYRLMCCLERYARKRLSKDADMKAAKKNKIAGTAIVWLRDPTPGNWAVLEKIIGSEGRWVSHGLTALNAIIQRLVYDLLGQKNRRVKV